MDYIVNRKWILRPGDEKKDSNKEYQSDEEELDREEKFEHNYNLRYELSDQAVGIKTYSRDVDGSVRR
jgi:hypothetical protein